MKIQVTLYDKERQILLTRHVINISKKEWQAMSFLEQEDLCKQTVGKSLHWHWRELGKNEA